MNNYINAKNALITGASAGIGKQIAIDLSLMNVNLILCGRNINKLEAAKKEILINSSVKITLLEFNVKNKIDVQEKIASFLKNEQIDILINNAGLALGLDPFYKASLDDWEEMIDTNIKGLLYVSRAIMPQMRDLETAHIINLGSVAGKSAYSNGNVYCATKAAVHSLGESMNLDLYGTSVKVSTIAPGAVETNFSNVRFKNDENKAQNVYEGYKALSAKDISAVIISVLNTPAHVNIQYLDIMPIAQRNAFVLYRDQEKDFENI
ncbi:MAG: SDR family NAD(P)-dependent oxidoreductase [Campylobacteraceae bacterium]|nr:SDR family NAD(P)-dependent oxidoreductase [Campylobacteraceae bacterium]